MIIPYKVVIRIFDTLLYGLIIRSRSAYFSQASYSEPKFQFDALSYLTRILATLPNISYLTRILATSPEDPNISYLTRILATSPEY